MPRGAQYDDGVPHSDNAIEAGEDKAHGTNPEPSEGVDRSYKAAEQPNPDHLQDSYAPPGLHSGGGSRGHPPSGSGKGGHDPKTLGDRKGLGAHKADGTLDTTPARRA